MNTHAAKITGWGLLAFTVFCLGFAGGAYAEKGGKGKGNDHGQYEDSGHHSEDHDSVSVKIMIGDDERSIITQFLGDDYRGHCPSGLARKNKNCLPPGQAKKYTIGDRLPDNAPYRPLPDELRVRLKEQPGYQYVMVDKDVVLIAEASKKVIDAVTLLSAIGN